jgi:hypothetical protein
MTWPFQFGTATSPVAASHLDDMFNQVGAMIEIPCSVTGTNTLSLTPLPNCPTLSAYTELCGYRFRAVGNSSGLVTAQYNGLGFLNVYHADGVTQCGTGDLINAFQYVIRFSQALNSGVGGFFLESPALAAAGTTPWGVPGGRLSFASTSPIMTSTLTGQQVIYYVPYNHQWIPIYNGSNIQPYQFSSPISNQSGPSLNMGGAANFTANLPWDIFATLVGGVVTLCAVAWTNATTRALTLATIGGVLTNSGSSTMQNGPNTSLVVAQNQGTFLGTVQMSASPGITLFQYGGTGVAGSFNLCNYYNKVIHTTSTTDGSAAYTYTSNVARQARSAAYNAVSFIQSDSERTATFNYWHFEQQVNVSGANTTVGLGLDITNGWNTYNYFLNNIASSSTPRMGWVSPLAIASTGWHTVNCVEAGDNANANTFDVFASNRLDSAIWL